MGLLGTLLVTLSVVLECSYGLGSLEYGGFEGAVDAQLGSNTRVDQALGVLSDPFLGNGVVSLTML